MAEAQVESEAPQEVHLGPQLRRALSLLKSGEGEEARRLIDAAIAREPFDATPRYLKGVALARAGEHDAAYAAFRRSLFLRPDHVDSAIRAGRSANAAGRHRVARDMFTKAIALQPGAVRAHRGKAFAEQGLVWHGPAVRSFRRALRLSPDDVPTLVGLASSLIALRKPERALVAARKAVAIDPERYETWLMLGDALQACDRSAEAEQAFGKALALKPDNAETMNAIGRLLGTTGRYREAQAWFRRAQDVAPHHVESHWNESLNALRMGDFETGWAKYEYRWQRKEAAGHPRFPDPLWLGGESLEGRTILLHGEQGIGDTIQFLRYVPHVRALGAKVLLGLQMRAEAIADCFPTEATIVRNRARIPPYEFHAPLGSLPLALRRNGMTEIPADVPYLRPAAERVARWRERLDALAPAGRPRVGLAWSGDPTHPNDRNRSIPFARLAPVLAQADAAWIVMQKPIRDSDRADVAASGVVDLGREFDDFHDTAAACSLLDMVVTVDTSIAHLAGALALETVVLVPFSSDWRWLVGREDTPWYPTMRLLRQPAPGDWTSVLDRLASLLAGRFGPAQARP